MLHNLTYELSVLAKAVQHKNLSAASVHIGLSQPQLSRLIAKIESELKVILLDRSARRKSGWTQVAYDLATTFSKGMGRLESEIISLAQEVEISELQIGSLEGLSTIASQFSQKCFDKMKMKTIHLNVLDFKDLDAEFLNGNLDLIFTVRQPGKQKFSHILEVGFQQMEKITTDKKTLIVSDSEYSGQDKKNLEEVEHTLVSNSLSVRKNWLKEFGGTGILPVDAKTGRGKGQYVIYLIGSNLLTPKIWENICLMMQ